MKCVLDEEKICLLFLHEGEAWACKLNAKCDYGAVPCKTCKERPAIVYDMFCERCWQNKILQIFKSV